MPNGLSLAVRASPKAKSDGVGGLWCDADERVWLSVKVRAAPDDGAANKALIAVLARTLELPKTAFSIESGHASRLKRLSIVCNTYEIITRLDALTGAQQGEAL